MTTMQHELLNTELSVQPREPNPINVIDAIRVHLSQIHSERPGVNALWCAALTIGSTAFQGSNQV